MWNNTLLKTTFLNSSSFINSRQLSLNTNFFNSFGLVFITSYDRSPTISLICFYQFFWHLLSVNSSVIYSLQILLSWFVVHTYFWTFLDYFPASWINSLHLLLWSTSLIYFSYFFLWPNSLWTVFFSRTLSLTVLLSVRYLQFLQFASCVTSNL